MLMLTVEVMRVPGAPEEVILLQGGSARLGGDGFSSSSSLGEKGELLL